VTLAQRDELGPAQLARSIVFKRLEARAEALA
jgi:hypothetical protein